jgi:hypothetical protein
LQALLLIPFEYSLLQGMWEMSWFVLDLTALAFAYIAWGILHYQCWKALPERYRTTTPGLAVGLLFIPFFNFYWAFITFVRLADGFNSWRDNLPELPVRDVRGLAIAKAVLFVSFWTLAFIPGLGSILCLVDLAVFALYYQGIVFNANLALNPRGKRV